MLLGLALGGGALFTGPRVPEQVPAPFDLDAVRALAGSEGPTTLRAANVVAGFLPGFLLHDIDGIARLAPGVVPIEAPGHTPGSVWLYVHESSGEESLFVGDTVWTDEAHPELPIMVAHDAQQWTDALAEDAIAPL